MPLLCSAFPSRCFAIQTLLYSAVAYAEPIHTLRGRCHAVHSNALASQCAAPLGRCVAFRRFSSYAFAMPGRATLRHAGLCLCKAGRLLSRPSRGHASRYFAFALQIHTLPLRGWSIICLRCHCRSKHFITSQSLCRALFSLSILALPLRSKANLFHAVPLPSGAWRVFALAILGAS